MTDAQDDGMFLAGAFAGALSGILFVLLLLFALGVQGHNECWNAYRNDPGATYRTTGGAFSSCQVEISPGIWVGPNSIRRDTPGP